MTTTFEKPMGGEVEKLKSDIATLNSNITNIVKDITSTVTTGPQMSNVTSKKICMIGKMVFVFMRCTNTDGAGVVVLSDLPKSLGQGIDISGQTYFVKGTTAIYSNNSFSDKAIQYIYLAE